MDASGDQPASRDGAVVTGAGEGAAGSVRAPEWVPGGADEAMAAVEAGLRWLARADAASLPAATQAECLRFLERAESAHTAARAAVLAAFTRQAVFEDDGQGSAQGWLRWQTRVTRRAAAAAAAWSRRLAAHPAIAEALAAAQVSVSWARKICDWSDKLPEERRADADLILLGAAERGADLTGLSALAEEMFRRCAPPDADGPDPFLDRQVTISTHFRGMGRLDGDLTPECSAALRAVLDSLGKRAGPEDERSKAQRDHDALEEAMRRLIAAGGLPDVAGQPTQIQLHVTLDQLRGLDRAAGTEEAPGQSGSASAGGTPGPAGDAAPGWRQLDGGCGGPGVRGADGPAEAAWLAGRAAGDGQPGWLADVAAAQGYACDAVIAPVVTGHVDPVALARAVRDILAGPRHDCPVTDCAETACARTGWADPGSAWTGCARHDRAEEPAGPDRMRPGSTEPGSTEPGSTEPDPCLCGRAGPRLVTAVPQSSAGRPSLLPPGSGGPPEPGWPPEATAARVRDVVLRYAADILSGPAGLAAWLRAGVDGPLGAGVSLPLDVGAPTATVPAHLRRAVIARDRHCAFPGCAQPPSACQVHHLVPRARGGVTALRNLQLLCAFHHLIVIHRWGWSLTLNGDGTTTATSPDGRILRSHGPPASAAA